MAHINEHYQKLQAGYLFPEIGRRVRAFSEANRDAEVIKLGIGDVTLPLAPAVVRAMHEAVDEMGKEAHGYGPENGYAFLTDKIREHDYARRGVEIAADEIFVSDGSKQDSGNIQEIFGTDCTLSVTDPSYPVYVDTNVMAGRTGTAGDDGRYAGITYLEATEANLFCPAPPTQRVDLAYLCSPNNPTGAVADRASLEAWVGWARANGFPLEWLCARCRMNGSSHFCFRFPWCQPRIPSSATQTSRCTCTTRHTHKGISPLPPATPQNLKVLHVFSALIKE